MFIVIAGAGKVGHQLARALIADHEILVIEEDPSRAAFVAEELGEEAIMQGDACDAMTMERAGMERADLVVAVTGDDGDNLTFCQIAKAKFNVPRAVARINAPQNETLFKRLGIGATLRRSRLNERSLAATLEQLLADKPMAAAAQIMGRKLVSEDGAEPAADALAMLAGRGWVGGLRAGGGGGGGGVPNPTMRARVTTPNR